MEKHSLNGILILFHVLNLVLLGFLLHSGLPGNYILIAMLTSTALILFLTLRILSRQYTKIKEIADKISKGDHSQRIPALNVNEFNQLGQSINKMLGKLDNTIGHLAIHREELRLILSTIEDALWSINSDGKIEWANYAFKQLFDLYDESKIQYYWDVFRDASLLSTIKEFNSGSEKRIKEINLGDHYFILSGSQNLSARRTVYFLQNINDIRQVQQMKKDFIVNLTHELRTPLTAIKGFSEAMEETAKAENIRYLKIIQNHTNRLISLINDLQILIRLERNESINLQIVNMITFFENIKMILDPLLEDKEINLIIDFDQSQPYFSVDPFKFEQVFINLVENSLRYASNGEICIRGRATEASMCLEVSDNGIGIAPEHLPRIFERFYVADPSRNRASGGTGLGLAIVKHIVMLHHGTINVSSIPGKGTTFRIEIPASKPLGIPDEAHPRPSLQDLANV